MADFLITLSDIRKYSPMMDIEKVGNSTVAHLSYDMQNKGGFLSVSKVIQRDVFDRLDNCRMDRFSAGVYFLFTSQTFQAVFFEFASVAF